MASWCRKRRGRILKATYLSLRINSGDAMHGDRVIARIERRRSLMHGGRAPRGKAFGDGAGRAEGRIVRVLGRAHPTVVGLFRHGPRGNVVLPYETRITQAIVIPAGEELDAGNPGEIRAPKANAARASACRNWTARWLTLN